MNLKFISLVMFICVSGFVQSSQRRVSFVPSDEVETLRKRDSVGGLVKKECWGSQLKEGVLDEEDSDLSVSLLRDRHISSLKETLVLNDNRLQFLAVSGLFLTTASFISSIVRFYDDCYKIEQIHDVCYQEDLGVCVRSQNILMQQLGIIGLYAASVVLTKPENKQS